KSWRCFDGVASQRARVSRRRAWLGPEVIAPYLAALPLPLEASALRLAQYALMRLPIARRAAGLIRRRPRGTPAAWGAPPSAPRAVSIAEICRSSRCFCEASLVRGLPR